MCFTFVWVGWDGVAHYVRIFVEALIRPHLRLVCKNKYINVYYIFKVFTFISVYFIISEKYYLVDSGYPQTK